MESPSKRRKISRFSVVGLPDAASTPQVNLRKVLAERQLSYSDSLSGSDVNSLFYNAGSSTSGPFESEVSSVSSFARDNDEEYTDYEQFLRRCSKISHKGYTWNLYRPTTEDEGALYRQLAYNPKDFKELACSFVRFCKSDKTGYGILALFRFYFDCSGFQAFDLNKRFLFPLQLDLLCKSLKNETFINSVLKSTKFLFSGDKTLLAQVLRYSIVGFLEAFVLEAHQEKMLNGAGIFNSFLSLLQYMCEHGVYQPLLATSFVFAAKILTTLCRLNVELLKMGVQHQHLNKLFTLLYVAFNRIGDLGASLPTLKTALISDLRIWIELSPKLFLGDFQCLRLLNDLITNQIAMVRLAALRACLKIMEKEQSRPYLKGAAMEELIYTIVGRVQDINDEVQLKALDVLLFISRGMAKYLRNKTLLNHLITAMYSNDYRVGSGAAECVLKSLSYINDSDITELMQLSEISQTHPKLAWALVESCINHTKTLQNWNLFVNILTSGKESSKMVYLSDLLYEAVYVTLRGKPTQVRPFSNTNMSVESSESASIADAMYPNVKTLLTLHVTSEPIVANIFRVLAEIDHTYLSQHYETLESFIQYCPIFFNRWNSIEVLRALLSYLSYVNKCFPNCSNCIKAITVLKTNIPKRFMNSLIKQTEEMFLATRKTALLFEAFDLNEYIEWTTLISAQNIDNADSKFLENIWTICHWSLLWRVKSLTAAQQLSAYWQMAMELFSNCTNSFKMDNLDLHYKAFERICETSIAILKEIRTISTKIYLKIKVPSLENSLVITHLMSFFHRNVEPIDSDSANQFRKYIFLIYEMVGLSIIPVECISSTLQYFEKYYRCYGKVFEALLTKISKQTKNCLPQLVLYTILLLFRKAHNPYELAIKPKKPSTDAILNLAKRFYSVKQIWCPEVIGKLLLFAVNYASATRLYDILTVVTIFISKRLPPEVCQEVLQNLEQKVRNEDKNRRSVSDFVKALEERIKFPSVAPARNITSVDQEKTSDGRSQAQGEAMSVSEADSSENEECDPTTNVGEDFAGLTISD